MKAKFYSVLVLLIAALTFPTAVVQAQPTGSKGGKFTVASGKQVRFSQGNLQFNVSQDTHLTADGSQAGTWRFAENQYDTIGKSNTNIIVDNYTGWISLFGWGTSGYNGKSPMMYVRDNAQYGDGTSDIAGTNYDWGVYNAISNGGNKPGLWRTPTREEYSYMLKNRANAEKLWSKGTVNGITGFIFLPDDWTLPAGITFTPKARYDENVYSIEQWTQLENNGAIFIPREGYQNYSTSNLRMEYSTGNHYLATGSCKSTSQRYVLSGGQTDPSGTSCSTFRYTGVPVRLVRTVEEFTVTFKDWDGTMLETKNVEYGFAATPPTDLVREGWTFTGWTASVSGMSKDYITDEVTFTAQYEKYITYTVTFVDGLTNDVIFVLTKAKGTTLETSEYPAVPTHEGNAFQGWFLPNGTVPVSTSLTVNSNLTLTARYTWDDQAGVLQAPMTYKNKFSVAEGRQVVFSQGNLQYQPSTGIWQFAPDQYTVISEADNKKLNDASYTGWIDIFNWSAEGAEYGLKICTEYPASIGTFVDWGQNPISNGGNKAGSWRTLSKDEWTYLLSGRPNAAELTFEAYLTGKGDLDGIVILPDDWKDNSVGASLLLDIDYEYKNALDADDWSVYEQLGALFLPYSSRCVLYGGENTWISGIYGWTKTYNTELSEGFGADWAYNINESEINSQRCSSRMPVRLARYDQTCPEISSEFSAEAIGCYTWGGKTYVSSGDYRRLYSTANGCDSVVTLHLTIEQEQPVGGSGALQGLFSVSADTQVRFSRGNLQYQEDTHTWRFAPEQIDIIGPTAVTGGWRDAFGWSSANSQFGLGSDFSGDFVDWGENAIANGGNRPNRWRTMTGNEWYYLFNTRPNAGDLRYSGQVDGRLGTILLPDDWTAPAGVTLVKSQTNKLTRAEWAILEDAGAVFLPFGGLTYSNYWSATTSSATVAYDMYYTPTGSNIAYQRSSTYQVRLVQEPVKPIGGTLTGKFSVSADKQVLFSQGNLQYKASTDTWQFAASQTEYIGEDNANVSPTYDGWIDLFGWGTGDRPTFTKGGPYDSFVDWGVNAISNGGNKPNVWRTLSSDEWDYLFLTRPNASQLCAIATVSNVKGMIFLPDNWVLPDGLTFEPKSNAYNYTINQYNATQWAKMAENGAVFLPAAGMRLLIEMRREGEGYYWTSTKGEDQDYRGCVHFYSDGQGVTTNSPVWHSSVRLVRDFVPGEDCTPVYASFTETACDTYTWNGIKYTLSGDYEQTFVTEQGCDSIVTLFLTINKSYETGFGEQAETSYTWQGTTYTESGDYTKTLQTVAGCDSIVTLHLTIGSDEPEDPEDPEQKWANGVLPGKFSVSAGKQVQFSQGNLQYKASDAIWRFAPNQTDTIGSANSNISASYSGWIDLFGWGTGSNPTLATTNNTDYAVFTDWGVNAISNGGNEANLWHTLTKDEWLYLFYTRTNAATLFGLGSVNGVNGTILLPDNWELPAGASFTASTTQGLADDGGYYYNSNGDNFSHNTYTTAQWETMEAAGAVFLPAAGCRYGTGVYSVGSYGRYWSATPYGTGSRSTYNLYFLSVGLDPQNYDVRYGGFSVRLVQDIVEEVTPVGAMTWRADDEDIKDLGTIVENTTIRGLTFVATADKAITVDANTKTYETLTFTHRIKLGGTIGETYRHLKFDVTGNATIEIYAISASSSATRTLNLAAGAYNSNLQQYDVTGTEVNYIKYEYTGNPTTIFIGSANSGINLLGIVLTPQCSDITSEFSETAEGSYTWNGTVYDESGDYTQTFPMANGCDSIVTLHLTITHAATDCISIETFVDEQPAYDVTFCPLTVLYANNKSTWVVDETGKAVQIYDNNKSYFDGTDTKGTVLNGVRGHYNNYKEQAEITPVAAPESKETTTFLPTPERIKEDMLDSYLHDANNFPYWYQRYVELHNATVILNNSKYYAWNNDIQVYNPYQFALTEGKGKNLIGVLTKFNDQVQLYLLEDEKDYDPIQEVSTWTVVTTNEIEWHCRTMPCANYEPCPAMDMTQVYDGIYQLQTYCSYISMANTLYSYPYWVVGDYNENIYRYPDLSQEFQYIDAAEIGIGLYNFTFTFDTNGPRLTLDWTPSTVFTVEGTSNWLDSEFDPTDTNNDMQCDPTGAWWQKFTQSENTDIETVFGAPAEDLYVLLKENVRLESQGTYCFNFVGYHNRAIWQLDNNPMEGEQLGVTEDGNYNVLFYFIPKYMNGYVIVEPARSNGLSDPSAVVLRPRKVIEDNSVIIIMPDGRRYNVLGTQVKQ